MKNFSIQNIKSENDVSISFFDISEKYPIMAFGQLELNGSNSLIILNLDTQKSNYIVKSSMKSLNTLSFMPQHDLLCYVLNESEINIINYKSLEKISVFKANNKIRQVKFKDNLLMIIGNYLEIWDWQKNEKLWFLKNYVGGEITKNWSYDSFQFTWQYPDYQKNKPYFNRAAQGVFTDRDNEILVCGNNTGKVLRINWKTNKTLEEILNAPLQVANVFISEKYKFLVVSGIIPDGDFLWTGIPYTRTLIELFNERMGAYKNIIFHPDEKFVIRGSKYGYVLINRLTDGETLFMEKLHDGEITSLGYDRVGNALYTSGMDGKINIISFDTEN